MNAISRGKFIAYLVLIFVAGGICGGAVTWGIARRPHGGPPSMEQVTAHLRNHLQTRLGLKADQVEKINPVLEQTSRDLQAVHEKSMGEVEQVFKRCNHEVAKTLTPEQKVKLEAMEREYRERGPKRGPGGPPPPP